MNTPEGLEPAGPHDPTRLSRDAIVAAALTIVDTVGAARFTMRQLGAALGVQAMSVYRYFPSRRAVLDAVVETVGMRTTAERPTTPATRGTWRTYLEQLAHRMRRLAITHPKLFLLVTSHPTPASWLRPPIRTVRDVDAFARRLADDQVSLAATAAAYKRFTAFLLGHLLGEVTTRNATESALEPGHSQLGPTQAPIEGPVEGGEQKFAVGVTVETPPRPAVGDTADTTDVLGYPHAAALARQLDDDTDTAAFEDALSRALDDVATLRHD